MQTDCLRPPRASRFTNARAVREPMLLIMARIDVLCLEDPCGGSHRWVDDLSREGILIGRDRERTPLHRTGLQVIQQDSCTIFLAIRLGESPAWWNAIGCCSGSGLNA
jgi:hypothetical protein